MAAQDDATLAEEIRALVRGEVIGQLNDVRTKLLRYADLHRADLDALVAGVNGVISGAEAALDAARRLLAEGAGGEPQTGATPELHVDYFDAQHNATHPDVQVWQSQMAWRGWVIDPDGAYGPQSEGVCRAFQQEKALTVDGQVGPETWAASWETAVDETEIDAQHANAEQQKSGELR